MSIRKIIKDHFIKFILDDGKTVPRELFELNEYFRLNDPVNFTYKREGGVIIGISTNFRHGSIVTSGCDEQELDENIKDAILTSFDIPSSYAKEAKLHRVGKNQKEHAYA